MKTLLLLEDNAERIAAFESLLPELGDDWQIRVWRDAPTMLSECEDSFSETHLISLDHDLYQFFKLIGTNPCDESRRMRYRWHGTPKS